MNTKARNMTAPKRALALLLALVLALGLLTVAAPRASAEPAEPDWPQLTNFSVTGNLYNMFLAARSNFACSVARVEIENYDEVVVAYSDNMVGVVRLYVNTPRTVEGGQPTDTAAEFPTSGSLFLYANEYSGVVTDGTLVVSNRISASKVADENKFRSTTAGVTIEVTQDGETIRYRYYLEVIPVADPDWPQLTSFSVTGNLYNMFLPARSNFACSVDHVEIENYDEVVVAYSENMIGVVRLYVNTPRTVEGGQPTDTAAEFPTSGSLFLYANDYSGAVTDGTLVVSNRISASKVADENKFKSTTAGVTIEVTQDGETIRYRYYLEIIPVEDTVPNTAPTIKSGVMNPLYTEAAAGTAWTLDLTSIFEDAEDDTLTYTVKVGSAAPVAADESYSYTPADGSETTLVFVANDGKLDSLTYTVVLNPAPNNAPNIKTGVENPATARIALGQRWDLDLYTIFEDADSDALTYTVKIGNAEPVATTQFYKFTPSEAGETTFEFRASDGRDESIAYTVNLTAVVNHAPTLKAGLSSSTYASATVGEAWTIDLSAIYEDADGDELTYSVRIPGYDTVSTPANYSFTPTEARQYSINFSPSDGLQFGPTYTVTLSAYNPNHAPVVKEGVVNPAAAAVAVGQAYTLDLSTIFEDPDEGGSVSQYRVSVNGAASVSASRNYSYTPETAGEYTLVFTAKDSKNLESTETYTVNLTADANLHAVSAATEDFYQWNNYTCNAMGIFTVKVGGNDVVAAAAGDTVTVSAIPQSILEGYAGAGTYVSAFAGWTAEGLSLTEEQAQSAELTFTMPDNPVTLKAAFVKVGSEVTLTANDFTAGDVEFGIDNWYINAGTSTWDYNTSQHGRDSVTDIVPGGKTVTVNLLGTHYSAYYLARWEVVNTTTNEPVNVTYGNLRNYPGLTNEYGQYQPVSFTVDGTSSYTITAIFEARDYGDVTVTVNDSTMGTATAQVGTAPAAGALEAVTAGQTVTLTAAPKTGYIFTGWTAAYGTDNTPVTVTGATETSASFVMPETNKAAVNVTATFAKDPQYASHDCALTDLNLYDGANNDFYTMETGENAFEITLDDGVDGAGLPNWTLVLELSADATATVNDIPWPAAGQAVGAAITLNEPATIVVTAEDGATTATYTLTVIGTSTAPAADLMAAVTNSTGTTPAATVNSAVAENGTAKLNVSSDKACVVIACVGTTYTRMNVNANADGTSYDFTVPYAEGMTFIVAVKGDVSGDGQITSTDWGSLVEAYNGSALSALNMLIGDVSGDGQITSTDWGSLVEAYNGSALSWTN